MIVLWILLWILLAVLLLLCLPLTLRVSWWYPKEQAEVTTSYLSPQVEKQLRDLELCEQDEQVLRQMVWELGSKKQPPEKELVVTLHYLFLHFTLYPIKLKPKQETKKEPIKKQEPQEPSQKPQKEDNFNLKQIIPPMLKTAKKAAGTVIRDICLHHVQLYVVQGGEDSAESALKAQKITTAVYTLLAAVQNWIRVKKTEIEIRPDFSGKEQGDWAVKFRVTIHPIVFLAAGVQLVVGLIKVILKQKTNTEKNSTPSKEDCGKQSV